MSAKEPKASKSVAESTDRPQREIRHDLGNALGALRLRVQLLAADPSCRAAQAKNLEAIDRIVNRSMELFAELCTHPKNSERAPKSAARAAQKVKRKSKKR